MSPRLPDLFLRSQSDERLVNLARAGHARAFAAIVERYGPELSALARRLNRDGRAEDIVQQAFLSAFAALRAGAEIKHLRGWLYQIVRNASTRERPTLCVPLDGSTPAPEMVEDVVQQRALALAALAELARLPERQREAMVGTALDGLARAEVASSMGLSEGAVRQLVHRARRTLRSAVTAVTPWPLAKWFATTRARGHLAELVAGAGTPGASELGASAGAVSSGGVAIKLGVVLASGTLATGIATVAIHQSRRDHPGRAARAASGHSAGLGSTAVPVANAVSARGGGGPVARSAIVVRVSVTPAGSVAGLGRSQRNGWAQPGRSLWSAGGGDGRSGAARSDRRGAGSGNSGSGDGRHHHGGQASPGPDGGGQSSGGADRQSGGIQQGSGGDPVVYATQASGQRDGSVQSSTDGTGSLQSDPSSSGSGSTATGTTGTGTTGTGSTATGTTGSGSTATDSSGSGSTAPDSSGSGSTATGTTGTGATGTGTTASGTDH